MKRKEGFTLIELLVVISIIAILMAVMMPALSKAREMAKRVVCQSGIRQIGAAVSAYSSSNNGYLVPQYKPTGYDLQPWYSPIAFNGSISNPKPYQFGVLYDEDYIGEPEIFYCPSQPRISEYPFPYYYDFYTGSEAGESVEWGSKLFESHPGHWPVRTSYNYWVVGNDVFEFQQNLKSSGQAREDALQKKMMAKAQSLSTEPVIFDNCQEWEVLPHKKNPTTPSGISTYFADGHANFCRSEYLFSDECWPRKEGWFNGPGNSNRSFENILEELKLLQ